MSLGTIRYNERSWAIDLIGHLKKLAASQQRAVRDAGGEQSVKGNDNSLFPDVLLFGDLSTARILQGWELKLPDTSIGDYEFRCNAEEKAKVLGLDSFVLWNVSHARLYGLEKVSGTFALLQEWNELRDIRSRADVQRNRHRWEHLAETILNRVNELLEEGTLEGRQFVEAYKSGGVTQLILSNTGLVAQAMQVAATRDVHLRSEISLWWQHSGEEYEGKLSHETLAQVNLINWIGKLLFAHILRERDSRARNIKQINEHTTATDALSLFQTLSNDCNFWTIFCHSVGLSILPDVAWSQLKQFNSLLSDLRVGAIDQEQLSDLLEATASVGSRKLRGQYTTPPELARLLMRLSVQNVNGRLLDPCCGSGTIARAALEYKLSQNIEPQATAASIFAADVDPQAVQLATFALAKPVLMSQPLRVFNKDAFSLTPDVPIEYRHPNDGTIFTEQLGYFHAITSNLPFVSQSGRPIYGDSIKQINQLFDDAMGSLSGKSDIAAYLPFSLYGLLEPGGRLGIIITNAWLGTDWGFVFLQKLRHYYNLKTVITSGAGRWFQNSKVVTNILICEKPTAGTTVTTQDIKFVVLKRPLNELNDNETLETTAAQIELGQSQDETMTIRFVTPENLDEYRVWGLAGNAQFVDVDWVRDLPLVSVSSLFEIRRGERRGWNPLFYPTTEHDIEPAYIRSVLKSPKEIERYATKAQNNAFSCSLSIDELRRLRHEGALAWIEQFADQRNGTGQLLSEALIRSGTRWYEMKADALTDFVVPINPGDRLFTARLDPPAFADQRFTCFKARAGIDVELCHALLNSTIGLFMIEGIGFGRGEGALDLNKDTVEKFMHMLDPSPLTQKDKVSIIQAFASVKRRRILVVADELEQADRQNLDDTIINAFNINVDRNRIYESLLNLVAIRQAAIQ